MTFVVQIHSAPIKKRVLSFIIDFLLLLPFILIGYQFWKEALWDGQSIGNRLVKIKLIHTDSGKKPSLKRIFLRNLVFIITLTLGSLFIFLNDGKRGLSDLLTKTMVINDYIKE